MSLEAEPQLRILVVDDQPGALENLLDILEDQDFAVTTAANGQAAREAIRTQQFDVALLDIRLPDARGTDLLREIRRANDNTRCIMVTASDDAEDAINALNDGASAYISKPIDIPKLLEKIRDVVSKYRKTVEERRRLRELDVVKSVGDVAMDLDLNRMLNNVIQVVVTGFAADAGAILFLDRDNITLRGVVQHNLNPDPIEDFVVPLGHGFTGRVAERDRVLSVEDLSSVGYTVPTHLTKSNLVSVIGCPVRGPRGRIGVMIVGWRTPHAFTVDDEHLIQVLSQRLGLATENARLYAREDASKQRAEFLARVSQELNSRIEDERSVVERVTRLATERLGDGCAVFVKRPNRNILDAILSFHRDPVKQKLLQARLREKPIRLGEGNIGRVAETGESIISGPESVEAYPDRPYLSEIGIRAAMAIPLRSRGRVDGVMSLSVTESDRHYTSEDLSLAEEFAQRASLAIENARLLSESHTRQQEILSLYQMTRGVTRSLDEGSVLKSLLQGTQDLISAPVTCIATMDDQKGILLPGGELGIGAPEAAEVVAACHAAWREKLVYGGVPFSVPDFTHCGVPVIEDCGWRHGLRSMLSVPFDVGGDSGGVLFAFTREVDPDLVDRGTLLNALGSLAGVAITNARSYHREQKIARRLQEWILAPESDMDLGVLEVATDYHAALNEASVGGDLYDIFAAGKDLVGVVIGDVSGKGLEAALQAQAVKHTLRAHALSTGLAGYASPGEVLARTNDAVCFMLPNDIFITLFFALVDVRTGSFIYANAGHDAPILLRKDGETGMLESTGRALGLLSGAAYEDVEMRLDPGDCMLLYTDGITEARRDGRFLETQGVVDLLQSHAGQSAMDVVNGIFKDTTDFSRGSLHDDVALLVLRYPESVPSEVVGTGI